MRLLPVADRAAGARVAAEIVRETLSVEDAPVLGVATGSTPLAVYRRLAELNGAGRFPTDGIRLAALDEYVGLGRDHPDGYRHYILREIADPLSIGHERVLVPEAWREDATEAAAEFERRLREIGGVQVQLLGIGRNGHIGFNEPGSPLDSRTRRVRLADATRRDNAPHLVGADSVPEFAITQGIATILEAGRLVLLAFGSEKARALDLALDGPIDPACPASAIRLHPDAVVIADYAALARTSASSRRQPSLPYPASRSAPRGPSGGRSRT